MTETDTANHRTEVGYELFPYGIVRGRIEGTEGDGNPIGTTKVSTTPDPLKLLEVKPPTKHHTWADL